MTETVEMLVCPNKGADYSLQCVTIDPIPRENELLVRMVATGVCHTDFKTTGGHLPIPFPFVGGHEGAGIVEHIGPNITHIKPGDHVLLTYSTCRTCAACLQNLDPYCLNLFPTNFSGSRTDASRPYSSSSTGEPISSFFFGQSSFAKRAIVNSNSAVIVPDDLPLKILAPLGCGIQTGAGTVLNVLKPQTGQTLAIFGAGAVGLAAVMAAALTPVSKIIVIDIVDSKLELAKELGATHVINSLKTKDVVGEIRELSEGLGVDRAMDTSGNIGVIQDVMLECVAPGGVAATVGTASLDQEVRIKPARWVAKGVSYVGVHQGSSVPRTFIPYLVQLWRDGRLPVEKLVRKYSYRDIAKVKEDIEKGECIKAILTWED